jgi:hypothetical protein
MQAAIIWKPGKQEKNFAAGTNLEARKPGKEEVN